MAKVSVIIPIYGVEKYIERCARSLFEQTLDDMEFIFIDDCTPDRSIEILRNVLQDYPSRIPQTRIEKMPHNSGLPAVRKKGVEIAIGDYLIGCDSDDWVEKEMYQDMYDYAVAKNLDLVHCDIEVVSDDGVLFLHTSQKDILSSDELKRMIIDGDIANSLCNKLVRRSVYLNEGVVFPVAGQNEDNTLACQLAYFSNSLGYIKKSYYKAYSNRDSMSRTPGENQIYRRYEEALSNSMIAVEFLKTHGYAEDSVAVLNAKIRVKDVLWPLIGNKKYVDLWKNTYKETNRLVIFDGRISYRKRIKFLLVFLNIVRVAKLMDNFKK